MINNLRVISVVIVSLLLVLTFSCKKEVPKVIPAITTTAVSKITSTTATCGGFISSDGGSIITVRGVCWSLIESPTTSDSKTTEDSAIGGFTSNITGLSPNTTYYLRAYASNYIGTAYGNQVVLTTLSSLPVITTIAVSNIKTTTATGGGFISFEGDSPVISRGVCWSKNQNPTIVENKTTNDSGSGSFVSSITGLSMGTTYYVRAYATNSKGTAYGAQISFTTGALPQANFEGSPRTIQTGQSVQFTDQSTNTPTSWYWTFGDAGTSTSQNPSHAYASAGIYTVALTVTNSFGSGNQTKTKYITVGGGIIFNPDLNYGSVTDIDGNVYRTISIGTQTWMAVNLKTTKYRNGNSIGTTTPATLDISNSSTYPAPKYQWAFAGNESNVASSGRLYTWYAATDSRSICPTGWHLPTDAEWTILTTYLGGESVAGGKLKETGIMHWPSPNTGATNSSGFTAIPGGHRYSTGSFWGSLPDGYWWSSTELDTNLARYRNVTYDTSSAYRDYTLKATGFSVRCVKD